MAKLARVFRLLAVVDLAGAMLAFHPIATAGPDQTTKDRCTAYAQRAVEQFNLMQSHPGCEKDLDPLAWNGGLDYHYRGCLLFPARMSALAQQGRDDHLQACGALSDTTAPAIAAPPATGVPGQAGSVPGASSVAEVPGGPPAPASTTAAGGGQCSQRPPAFFYSLNPSPAGAGVNPSVKGGTLTFTQIDSKTPSKRETVSFKVRRPAFWLAYLKCAHATDDANWNYWVWVSDSGRDARYFAMGGLTPTLTIWAISPQGAAQLVGN